VQRLSPAEVRERKKLAREQHQRTSPAEARERQHQHTSPAESRERKKLAALQQQYEQHQREMEREAEMGQMEREVQRNPGVTFATEIDDAQSDRRAAMEARKLNRQELSLCMAPLVHLAESNKGVEMGMTPDLVALLKPKGHHWSAMKVKIPDLIAVNTEVGASRRIPNPPGKVRLIKVIDAVLSGERQDSIRGGKEWKGSRTPSPGKSRSEDEPHSGRGGGGRGGGVAGGRGGGYANRSPRKEAAGEEARPFVFSDYADHHRRSPHRSPQRSPQRRVPEHEEEPKRALPAHNLYHSSLKR
jgi:hypothetical protein